MLPADQRSINQWFNINAFDRVAADQLASTCARSRVFLQLAGAIYK